MRLDAADPVTWEYREDRGELLRPVRRGNLLFVEGIAAKEGILEYRRADGTVRREFVPASTLLRAGVKLARAPVTLLHPDPQQYPHGVTPENYDQLGVGDVDGEVIVGDGGFTRVKLAIRRKDAIESVEKGDTRELSCGYNVRLDETPGENAYGKFDATQIERADNNHLALVPMARAGREAAVRADGAVATTVIRADSHPAAPAAWRPTMRFLLQALALLGDTERYDSEEVAGAALVDRVRGAAKNRADAETEQRTEIASTVTERDAQRSRADAAERDRDAARADADAAKAKLATLQTEAKTRADAAERTDLADLCARYRVDAAGELPKVKRQIAAAFLGAELRADASDDYVNALVDAAKRDHVQGREAGEHAWDPAPPPVRRDGEGRRPSARERYHAALGLDKAS